MNQPEIQNLKSTESSRRHIHRRSPKEIIQALRTEAAANPVFNAVCHTFAMRERARHTVTLPTLKATVNREGYQYSLPQYEKTLRFLAELGVGKMMFKADGKLWALQNIKFTLQSIGLAAVGTKNTIESFEPSAPRSPLGQLTAASIGDKERELEAVLESQVEQPADAAAALPPVARITGIESIKTPYTTVLVNGEMVAFEIPRPLSTREFVSLITAMVDGFPVKAANVPA